MDLIDKLVQSSGSGTASVSSKFIEQFKNCVRMDERANKLASELE
jgi:hypothetical protein